MIIMMMMVMMSRAAVGRVPEVKFPKAVQEREIYQKGNIE